MMHWPAMRKLQDPTPRGMKRIAKFWLSPVLNRIGPKRWKVRAQVDGQWRTFNVKMSGERMKLLGRTQKCACCGVEGKFFWLESSGARPPHFNLYGVFKSGRAVLMTMDHITPKSKGGKTEESNLQLLCSRCNEVKKDHDMTLEELRAKVLGRVVELADTQDLKSCGR